MSGLTGLIKNVLSIPVSLIKGPDKLPSPPKIEDPQVVLEREATNAAIAGDIAVRNARRRSSTLGAGANFLKQQQKQQVQAPTNFFSSRGNNGN